MSIFGVGNNSVLSTGALLANQVQKAQEETVKEVASGKLATGNKYITNGDMGELAREQQNLEAARLRLEKGQINAKALDVKCTIADSSLSELLDKINSLDTDIKSYSSSPPDRAPAILAGINNVLALTQSTLNATYDNGIYIFGTGDRSPIQDNVAVIQNYGTDNVPSNSYVADPGQVLNKYIDGSNIPLNTYLDPSAFKNLIAGLHQIKTALTITPLATLPDKLPAEAVGYFNQGVTDVQTLKETTVHIMWDNATSAVEANSKAIQYNAAEMEKFVESVTDFFTKVKGQEKQNELLNLLQVMRLRASDFASLYRGA